MLKRVLFVVFAALLLALPSVSAAQSTANPDTVWLKVGAQKYTKEQINFKPGQIVLALQMNPKIVKAATFGDGVTFDGVTVITNAPFMVAPGNTVHLNRSRFLYSGHPEAQKILASLGITIPTDWDGLGDTHEYDYQYVRWNISGTLEARDTDILFPDFGYDVKTGGRLDVYGGNIEADRTVVGTDALKYDGTPWVIRTNGVTFKSRKYDLILDVAYINNDYADEGSSMSKMVALVEREDNKPPKGRAVFNNTRNLRFSSGAGIAQVIQPLAGDFDKSGLVDFDDFFAFAAAFGQSATGDNAKFDLAPNGQIDFEDFFVLAAAFGQKAGKPIGMLGNNFPNPFNPVTTISYALAIDAPVSLRIYNTLGQVVRTLVHDRQTAGRYSIQWNGKDEYGRSVASGIYFARLEAGQFPSVRKLTLLK